MEVATQEPTIVDRLREHQLQLPGMDGYTADKLTVSLTGSLDRTSADDVDVLAKLKMFEEVTLEVKALVVRKGFAGQASEDKGDTLGYSVGLKVLEFELA